MQTSVSRIENNVTSTATTDASRSETASTLNAKVAACVGEKIAWWMRWCLVTGSLRRACVCALLALPLLLQVLMPQLDCCRHYSWTWTDTLVWLLVGSGPQLLSLFIMWRFNGWWWDIVERATSKLDAEIRDPLTCRCYGRFRVYALTFLTCQTVSCILYIGSNSTNDVAVLLVLVATVLFGMSRVLLVTFTVTIHEFASRVTKHIVSPVLDGRCGIDLCRKLTTARNITFVSIWVGSLVESSMLLLWHNRVIAFPPIPVPLVTFTLYSRDMYTAAVQLSSGFVLVRLIFPFLIVVRASTLTVYQAKQKRFVHDTCQPNEPQQTADRWLASNDYVFSIPIFRQAIYMFPLLSVAAWVLVLLAVSRIT